MAQVNLNALSPSFNSSSNISSTISNSPYRSPCSGGGEQGAYSVDSSQVQQASGPDIVALKKLSSNIESLLSPTDIDCSDAEIWVEDRPVSVHRCILAARSPFFRMKFFSGTSNSGQTGGTKMRYELKDWLVKGNVGYDAFMILLGYLYSGKVKEPAAEVCTCIDDTCAHGACSPAVNFVVQLMYGADVFKIPELVSLLRRQLLNFVEKALVEDVIPILVAANACESGNDQLLNRCIHRVARSDLDMVAIEKELPQEVVKDVLKLRTDLGLETLTNSAVDKTIRRIQRALDSGNVEMVILLLEDEKGRILNDAYALHYAVAYCDATVTAELLELPEADVNLRNPRGYTVLHIAAMRRHPRTIVSLLTKGACPSDLTNDDRTALHISRRLTRVIDYEQPKVQGKKSYTDKLCIDILRQAENPWMISVPRSNSYAINDLKSSLQYLQNRVAFAKLLFPMEAKVAMEISRVDMTSEFTVDLSEIPNAVMEKKLRSRMEALTRTVDLGYRYFPCCSYILNKFIEDEVSEHACSEKGTPEEQEVKLQRYNQLKDNLSEAFNKDYAEYEKSDKSSSSSSSSQKCNGSHKSVRIR